MTDFSNDYAGALYSLAEDLRIEEKVLVQITEIQKQFSENPDFIKLLDSPALTVDERLDSVDAAFGAAEEIVISFIKILTEKRAVHLFGKCAAAFENEYNEKHNIETVTAETAIGLTPELSGLLKKRLEEMTGKTVKLYEKVRPELLGGIKLSFKNKEIDGSILKKLKEIEKAVSAV